MDIEINEDTIIDIAKSIKQCGLNINMAESHENIIKSIMEILPNPKKSKSFSNDHADKIAFTINAKFSKYISEPFTTISNLCTHVKNVCKNKINDIKNKIEIDFQINDKNKIGDLIVAYVEINKLLETMNNNKFDEINNGDNLAYCLIDFGLMISSIHIYNVMLKKISKHSFSRDEETINMLNYKKLRRIDV